MKRDLISRVLREVLNESIIRDTDNSDVTERIDNAHRLLNKAQRTLYMQNQGDSDLFATIREADNILLDILNDR